MHGYCMWCVHHFCCVLSVYKLGKKWEKVVEDFAAHYRIRTERCQLGLVQILAEKFEPTFRYLSTVVDDWSPVCTAAREGKLTKTELAMHSDIARSTYVTPIVSFCIFFPAHVSNVS